MRSSPPSKSLVLKIVKPPVPSASAASIWVLVGAGGGNCGTVGRGRFVGEFFLLGDGPLPPPAGAPPGAPPPPPAGASPRAPLAAPPSATTSTSAASTAATR